MKIIAKGKLKKEQIKNINELEEVIGGQVLNFHMVKIDLENGKYADIISYLDTTRAIVTVSIQEIGMLTNKIFSEEICELC